MRAGMLIISFSLIVAALVRPAMAGSQDILDLVERDLRERYADRARERARARAEELATQKQEKLPDLSQFGVPLEERPTPRLLPSQATGTDCVTVDLTNDMHATHCF